MNRTIPLYSELESLHENAREMPRLTYWPRIAEIIDQAVSDAINTPEPIPQILERAEIEASQLRVSS